jgi:hypothetical protein
VVSKQTHEIRKIKHDDNYVLKIIMCIKVNDRSVHPVQLLCTYTRIIKLAIKNLPKCSSCLAVSSRKQNSMKISKVAKYNASDLLRYGNIHF